MIIFHVPVYPYMYPFFYLLEFLERMCQFRSNAYTIEDNSKATCEDGIKSYLISFRDDINLGISFATEYILIST